MTVHVKVAANGRICIPADVRSRLGLKDGDMLLLEELDDGFVLLTSDQGIARARAIYRRLLNGRPGQSVDEFIAERRRGAEREEEEYRAQHA